MPSTRDRLATHLGLDRVDPTAAEVAAAMPGDDLLPHPDVVMDRAFTVDGAPQDVWPWLVQLGKRRAGWYLPRAVERFVPRSRRATRAVEPRWQHLRVGDVIPDYGGRDETFTVAELVPASHLVHTSRRGAMDVIWAIRLTAAPGSRTRVQLRLRLHPVKRRWLAESVGGAFDLLTVAGLAAGLAERLAASRPARR